MKVYLSEYIHPAAVEHLKSHAEIVDNFDHPGELDGMVVRGVKVTREMIERSHEPEGRGTPWRRLRRR